MVARKGLNVRPDDCDEVGQCETLSVSGIGLTSFAGGVGLGDGSRATEAERMPNQVQVSFRLLWT